MSSDTEYYTVEVTVRVPISHSVAEISVSLRRPKKSQEIVYVATAVRVGIGISFYKPCD